MLCVGSPPRQKEVQKMKTLKSELLQIIEQLDEYQLRLVLSFVKTLFF